MEIVASILFGIFVFSILLIMQYTRGKEKEEIMSRIEAVTKSPRDNMLLDDELNKPLYDRIIKPLLNSIAHQVRDLFPKNKTQKDGQSKTGKLKQKLRQAGIRLDTAEYQAVSLLVMGTLSFLAFIVSLVLVRQFLFSLLCALLSLYMAYVILRFDLSRRVTKRRELMSRQIPDVLDTLSVSVEAGLGLEQAILHVIEHFNGPLIDELAITYREMSMGRTRREAFTNLGERVYIEEVKSFCRSIVQAGQMGIPIKSVLRAQAYSIRQARKSKVEEKAQKVAIKILFPMIFLIFPVMFIILLGPALISILEVFG